MSLGSLVPVERQCYSQSYLQAWMFQLSNLIAAASDYLRDMFNYT